MAAQPPPPPPPPSTLPTPTFFFAAPTPVASVSGPMQRIAALQHSWRQEMTPEGYFGPQHLSSFKPVTPEGVGGKVPPTWGQSANSFLQDSPLPLYQIQPLLPEGISQAGAAVA
jgi:hypothetical protein